MLETIPIPEVGFSWRGVDNWRLTNLVPYIFQRENWTCWVEDCHKSGLSVHESLITRGDVQGWLPKVRRVLVFHPVNCIALCNVHHNTALEPSRQEVLEWMIGYYGKDFMYGWLVNISKEFKIVPSFVREILRREKDGLSETNGATRTVGLQNKVLSLSHTKKL